MSSLSLLKKSTGEAHFKSVAKVKRFESEVWTKVEHLILDVFEQIALQAGQRATKDQRTVINPSDIELPSSGRPSKKSSGTQRSGKALVTPESLFRSIQSLPTEDVVRFIKLLETWVKEEKEATS